jgi:hypothetical protein
MRDKPGRKTKEDKTGNREKAPAPAREEIARRAFELFVRRGGEPGHEEEDWLRAEKALREEKTLTT